MDGSTTYYHRNRETIILILNNIMRTTKIEWKIKQKINIENYLKKKNIKREYGRNRYRNVSEEKKQRLKEHQKIIMKQNQHKIKRPVIIDKVDIKDIY